MTPCPECGGRSAIIANKPCSNGSRRLRRECRVCGHRWTQHLGDPPGHCGGVAVGFHFSSRSLTPDQVREILLMTGSIRSIAARVGRSQSTIRAILDGETYNDLHPDLPRRHNLTCHRCLHWLGRCGLEFPDPLKVGPRFAADCASFIPVNHET